MQNEQIKTVAIKNILWKFAERCGAQFVNLIITIILARILLPEDFGIIALINVFIVILNVFVDSGMANALIQKKNVDNKDFSSVFYFNIFQGIIIYILLYLLAPFIASFYENADITAMIRVAGTVLLISSIKNVQQAYVAKKLIFQKFFWATLIGTIISSVIGILLAYMHYGVWALIIQNVLNQLIDTIVLWIIVKWRPEKYFSFRRIGDLLSYGIKLLFSALIDTVYNNFQVLFIGKYYTESELAYYSKGKQLPGVLVININSAIESVLFPIMSDVQENREELKKITRNVISASTIILWPILAAVIASATEVVTVLLTEKWIDSVIFLQIFCLSYALWPIHTANLSVIKAYGKSDIFLKLEILKKAIGLTILLLVYDKGVHMIAASVLITGPISAFINWFPNSKNLSYRFFELLKDLLPAFGMAVAEFIVVYLLSFLPLNIYLKFILQIMVGMIIYILMLYFVKRNLFLALCGFMIKQNKR